MGLFFVLYILCLRSCLIKIHYITSVQNLDKPIPNQLLSHDSGIGFLLKRLNCHLQVDVCKIDKYFSMV